MQKIIALNDNGASLPWANKQNWFLKRLPQEITYPVSTFIYLLSVISWVVAGQDKASYCLAYITTLSAYLWTQNDLGYWVKFLHIVGLVALLIVTIEDIAGYVTVPWIFTLVYIVYYVFALVDNRDDEFFVLAMASFVLSVWQAIDTDVHY